MKLARLKTIVRWIAILLVVAFLALNVILPFGFGFFATLQKSSSVGTPPDGFQEIALTTSDDVKLSAWYAPPQNGAVIVLVHGSGDSREDIRKHAALLVEHGFGVLALDMRGHGESGGETNRFGWQGSKDVGAAVDYLAQQSDVEAIGGLGLSLGGEVLLGAASDYPAMRAIVSEGATYRSFDEYTDLESNGAFFHSFPQRILYFSVGLFSGEKPPKPILDSIKGAPDTAFLFIAGGNMGDEIDFSALFVEAAGDRAEVWAVPGANHIQGLSRAPDDYEQKVISFFEAALLN